jgi:hypothetical protein
VLVLTAFAPEERAASQIIQSANDYLIKGQLSPGTLMRSIKVADKCQGLQWQLLDVLSASSDGMIVVDEQGCALGVNLTGATMACSGFTLRDCGEAAWLAVGKGGLNRAWFRRRTYRTDACSQCWGVWRSRASDYPAQRHRAQTPAAGASLPGRADDLTGLINRPRFSAELNMAFARAPHKHSRLPVLFLELDRFKPVNDAYGHAQGNALLNGIAHRLSKNWRAGKFVSRLVGDYFTLIAEDVKPSSEAHHRTYP